eukprot:scaffold2347_cov287-Chaetoceros_neogracile.AAC.14
MILLFSRWTHDYSQQGDREESFMMRFVERDDATIDPEIMGKSRFSSSVTTKMANSFLRGKGILLRTRVDPLFVKAYDQNGRDNMPASFLHASMQAPNCIYR